MENIYKQKLNNVENPHATEVSERVCMCEWVNLSLIKTFDVTAANAAFLKKYLFVNYETFLF